MTTQLSPNYLILPFNLKQYFYGIYQKNNHISGKEYIVLPISLLHNPNHSYYHVVPLFFKREHVLSLPTVSFAGIHLL